MKKIVKNKDLIRILQKSESLNSLRMPSELTFAIFDAKAKVLAHQKILADVSKQISESRCEKDENLNPVYKKIEAHGQVYQVYKFKNTAHEICTMNELNDLSEAEVEFETREFTREKILAIAELTSDQLEAINYLIEIK